MERKGHNHIYPFSGRKNWYKGDKWALTSQRTLADSNLTQFPTRAFNGLRW